MRRMSILLNIFSQSYLKRCLAERKLAINFLGSVGCTGCTLLSGYAFYSDTASGSPETACPLSQFKLAAEVQRSVKSFRKRNGFGTGLGLGMP